MTAGTVLRRNAGAGAPWLPQPLAGHEKEAEAITGSLNVTKFSYRNILMRASWKTHLKGGGL